MLNGFDVMFCAVVTVLLNERNTGDIGFDKFSEQPAGIAVPLFIFLIVLVVCIFVGSSGYGCCFLHTILMFIFLRQFTCMEKSM